MGLRSDPLEEFQRQWKHHAREARRLHEKLFYRPLLQAVARLDAGEARLTLQAAEDRMRALGFTNPSGALGHVTALTSGVSRRAAIQRTLLPVLLGWFADGPDPDGGLLGFRQVSDHLGSTPWYLRLLRDESTAAEHLAHILSSSRYATDLLLRAPESVQVLGREDEIPPRSRDSLWSEVEAIVARHDSAEAVVNAVRAMRRKELFRLAVAQILGRASAEQVSRGLTDVMEAVIHGGLCAAWMAECQENARLAELAVIAMGRFGGAELGFGSDADVLFVYEPRAGATDHDASAQAFSVVNRMRELLTSPSPDPAVEIDADLRPEGKNGPLVRSLVSYAAYYEKWSSPWEAQALLRARHVVGSDDLGQRFIALIDPLRYPVDGISADSLREMRRLKARMESERLPRGAEPRLHTKQGPGGLADVEWVAQLLQLQHAHDHRNLQIAGTLPALKAAHDSGLISHPDVQLLSESWAFATAIRNAGMLARGRASDMVPTDPRESSSVAFILGKGSGGGAELREDYLRVTRRARAVTERLFYGASERDS
jgi:glutamate-ammonia-ligase adenylyltransferase